MIIKTCRTTKDVCLYDLHSFLDFNTGHSSKLVEDGRSHVQDIFYSDNKPCEKTAGSKLANAR